MNTLEKFNYESILEHIKYLEEQERSKTQDHPPAGAPKEQDPISRKYEIIRISLRQNFLMSFISLNKGFLKAYKASSHNRWLLLTNHHVKVNINEADEANIGTILTRNDPGFEAAQMPHWFEWKGCGMEIPETAFITLNPNIAWPVIFIKRRAADASDHEYYIRITERAWNADVFSPEDDLIVKKGSDGRAATTLSRGFQTISERSLGNSSNGNEDYSLVSLEVQEKLEEFDVVVDVPFFAPYLDVLTEVSFKESERQADILMTFCAF